MKLSFSTRGWQKLPFDELVGKAAEMGFGGIELYDPLKSAELMAKGGTYYSLYRLYQDNEG